MLDVCAFVVVEEEKGRKARGNLCAKMRGIMVWRNWWLCWSRDPSTTVRGPVQGTAV